MGQFFAIRSSNKHSRTTEQGEEDTEQGEEDIEDEDGSCSDNERSVILKKQKVDEPEQTDGELYKAS